MILPTSAASLALAALAAAGASHLRAGSRSRAAERLHPPRGRILEVAGRRLHVVVAGEGPDLVLLHGASGSSLEFTAGLMPALAPHFRVIVPDRPGLGHSDPLPGATALARQAAHLQAGLAQLGVTRPLLVGHSFGGSVALAWATSGAPEPGLAPAGLVLVSAPALPWPGPLDPWYRANATRLGRAVLPPLAAAWVPISHLHRVVATIFAPEPVPDSYAAQAGLGLALRSRTLGENVDQVNALKAQLAALQPAYPALSLPVELLHGDADTVVPIQIHARPLQGLIPGAALTELAGAGHMPHHTRPHAVIAAILRAAARAGLPPRGTPAILT